MKISMVIAALVATVMACGEGEYYTECGTACPITCDNYKNPPQACIALCVPGCYCNPGLYRNSTGTCVALEDC